MQGDIYRAKQKDKDRLRDRHNVSKLLSGVDDMKIQDTIENNRYVLEDRYYEDDVS